MNGLIITNIKGFNFSNNKEPLNIWGHNYFFIDNEEELLAALNMPILISSYGYTYIKNITSTPFFIKHANFTDLNNTHEVALNELNLLNFFFQSLWLIKDNSAHVKNIVVYNKNLNGTNQLQTNQGLTNCEGNEVSTIFTLDEINHAFEIIKIIDSDKGRKPIPEIKYNFDPEKNSKSRLFARKLDSRIFNRIDRALQFIAYAQSNSDLHIKITFYVFVLECLFCPDFAPEIIHRLSERVAKYIGIDYKERTKIYSDVKRYYNVRSKYVHGQALENKHSLENLLVISKELDELNRRILNQVIKHDFTLFVGEEKLLTEYLNKIILS